MSRTTGFITMLLCVVAIVLVAGNSWRTAIALTLVTVAVLTWIDEICVAVRKNSTTAEQGKEDHNDTKY